MRAQRKVSSGKSVAPVVSDEVKAEAAKVAAKVKGTVRPDWLTPKNARDGKFADLDAAAAWVESLALIARDAKKTAWYDAGIFVHGVYAAGNVGRDKAYATAKALGEAIGYSESDMSKIRVVGRGVCVHGITKGSHAYTVLASNAGKAVTAAVKLEDSDECKRLLNGYYAEIQEHGRITQGAAGTPRLNGTGEHNAPNQEGQSDVTPTGDVATPEPSAPVDPLKVASDALKAYDAALKAVPPGAMPRDVWSSHEDRLNAIIQRVNGDILKAEGKGAKPAPAKVKATPLTAARKADEAKARKAEAAAAASA